MSKSRQRKKERKRKTKRAPPPTLSTVLKAWWIEKHPVLLFLGRFILFLVLFHLIRYTAFFSDSIHPFLTHGNAWLSHLVLNVFGQDTIAQGASIHSPVFTMSIVHGCDATEAVMIFASVVLAFPVAISKRIIGVITGTVFLLFMNLFRVISLFFIGVYFKDWFEFAHIEAWQFIFIMLALGTCVAWLRWATPRHF